MGLETTRAVVERGIVMTDEHMRTADPHLYAVGDIAGGLWLAHVATHEGILAVSPSPATTPSELDYVKMPRATYSRPQVASIGLTSERAPSGASRRRWARCR